MRVWEERTIGGGRGESLLQLVSPLENYSSAAASYPRSHLY